MNSESESCAVAASTPNVRASVGCAGRLMSIESATTAVSAASVMIQRVDPIAAPYRGLCTGRIMSARAAAVTPRAEGDAWMPRRRR